jgi:hypothetical protein
MECMVSPGHGVNEIEKDSAGFVVSGAEFVVGGEVGFAEEEGRGSVSSGSVDGVLQLL